VAAGNQVAHPGKHIPLTMEDALAELKRDPSRPLRLAIDDVEVEMRIVGGAAMKAGADALNGATWHGETAAEAIQIITLVAQVPRSGWIFSSAKSARSSGLMPTA
jgi:hypothetical protein